MNEPVIDIKAGAKKPTKRGISLPSNTEIIRKQRNKKSTAEALVYSSQEEGVWRILGAERFMPAQPVSSLDLLDASLSGVSKQSIASLAKVLELPLKDMATLLNLSYKTLGRKKDSETFDSVISSLSIEIAGTVAHGITVFEDIDKFNRWLNKENRALKSQKPIDLLSTPTGIKLVNQILGRIDEGVYS